MTPAIDVHTHMLNRDWLELLRAHGRPRYELRTSLDAPEGIFLDGAPFMTPQPGHFDYPYRIQGNRLTVGWDVNSVLLPAAHWLAVWWSRLTGRTHVIGVQTIDIIEAGADVIRVQRPAPLANQPGPDSVEWRRSPQ